MKNLKDQALENEKIQPFIKKIPKEEGISIEVPKEKVEEILKVKEKEFNF